MGSRGEELSPRRDRRGWNSTNRRVSGRGSIPRARPFERREETVYCRRVKHRIDPRDIYVNSRRSIPSRRWAKESRDHRCSTPEKIMAGRITTDERVLRSEWVEAEILNSTPDEILNSNRRSNSRSNSSPNTKSPCRTTHLSLSHQRPTRVAENPIFRHLTKLK